MRCRCLVNKRYFNHTQKIRNYLCTFNKSGFVFIVEMFNHPLLLTLCGVLLKLIWNLRKTTAQHNSTDNTTTNLKYPDYWRRELLKVMKIDVKTRLNDLLMLRK